MTRRLVILPAASFDVDKARFDFQLQRLCDDNRLAVESSRLEPIHVGN